MSQQVKSENYISDISFNNVVVNNSINENKVKDVVPFWSENPNILLDQRYIFEYFPVEPMSYNQKLNTITRITITLTLIGFILSQNIRIIIIGLITIGTIFLIHYYHTIEDDKLKFKKTEGFLSNVASDYLDSKHIIINDNTFQEPDSSNPFSNVLMTDYDYNPNKKPAPPSFNKNINSKILKEAKQLVVEANPDQPDIADKLFKDLGEQLVFEQSMRQFNSTSNTTIPNDQGAFAEFCYGSMISCKEGNNFACARNLQHYNNY